MSYHNREWKGSSKLTERIKQIMQNNGQYAPNYIPIAYRHEVFVLEVEENKKKFKKKSKGRKKYWNTVEF